MREPIKRFRCWSRFALLAFTWTAAAVLAQTLGEIPRPDFFRVTLDHSFASPVSGRLLLFIAPTGGDANSVDMDMMSPTSVYVAAREVAHLVPGESVDIDADDMVFPRPLSRAPAGSYRVQAVLDVHHNYNYAGRVAGDLLSVPATVSVPLAGSSAPVLTLSQLVPEDPDPLSQRPDVSVALKP